MAKTPLLLVPGLLCSPRLYAAQTAALSDIAEIVVPDWRQAPLSIFDTWKSTTQWVLDRMPDKKLVDEVMAMCTETGVEIYKRQEALAVDRIDRRADLPKIKCPTVVVCGRDDAATPLFLSEEIAAAIKGSELVVVEQCGHLVTMEKPEETNAILRRWLSR
jgi:pimeloyl-ACP methyl ester carboxylesterase